VRYDFLSNDPTSTRRWIRAVAVLLLLFLLSIPSLTVLGQQQPEEEAKPEERTSVQEESVDDPFSDLDIPAFEGNCPPPSTQEQIMIGVGALALVVICYFLLVRLMERRYILQDRSALVGRHLGFSLTIFMTSLGFVALVYLVTGCLHPKFLLWLGFAAALWIVHGIYTLIVVRN